VGAVHTITLASPIPFDIATGHPLLNQSSLCSAQYGGHGQRPYSHSAALQFHIHAFVKKV
jgi:hypothetical protein